MAMSSSASNAFFGQRRGEIGGTSEALVASAERKVEQLIFFQERYGAPILPRYARVIEARKESTSLVLEKFSRCGRNFGDWPAICRFV